MRKTKQVLRNGRFVIIVLYKCDRCGTQGEEETTKVRAPSGRWLEVCKQCKGNVDQEIERLLPPEARTPRKRPPRKRGLRLAPWERKE